MKQSVFNFETGSNVFFTSDTHFGHANIIHFCKRPFASVEEMDEKLIENWNKVVGPNDYIFHLGDFCFKGSQYWDRMLDQLNGHKFLILGNHDFKNLRDGNMFKFDWVGQQAYVTIGGRAIFLNHFPFLCYGGSYRSAENSVWQLHGHVHLNLNDMSGKDISRLTNCFPTQYDVGVDANNFTPISFDDVSVRINEQMTHNQNQYDSFKEYLEYAKDKEKV